MKKPSSKIREEISRLQEALKIAETREAERLGRLALKAGLGDIALDETALIAELEKLARRFSDIRSGSRHRSVEKLMADDRTPQGTSGEV